MIKPQYIIFVGDEEHEPRERLKPYIQYGRIQNWLFEHNYSGEELMWTAEKERWGKYFAVIREIHTSTKREWVILAQSKKWMYSLDFNNPIVIRWRKSDPV